MRRMDRRLFHFSEGTSNKFRSIETTGTGTLVHPLITRLSRWISSRILNSALVTSLTGRRPALPSADRSTGIPPGSLAHI